MQFSTLWVASAAVLATLLGSFVVAPFIGRLLKKRQPPPMPEGTLVASIEGDPATATVHAHGYQRRRSSPGYVSLSGDVSLELRAGRRSMWTTLSPTAAARLAASLLALVPIEDDEPEVDDFLRKLHTPTDPGQEGSSSGRRKTPFSLRTYYKQSAWCLPTS